MRETTYERILQRVCALKGHQRDDLQADEEQIIRNHVGRSLKEIWSLAPWPQVCVTEARTPAANVISYEQSSELRIDTVFAIYDGDPHGTAEVDHVPFALTADGIRLTGEGSTDDVYVYYRKWCPDLTGDDYAAATAYAVDDQVYYPTTGDFYRCILTSTGNLPTNTTYWERQSIPFDFLEYVAHCAYADWLRSEGQDQKAAAQAATSADRILGSELDKLERQQGVLPPLRIRTHSTEYPA
jgi:hypothetical protein